MARHLHLPLQSGCAATLKRMARKTTPKGYAQLLNDARSQIPDVAITTDVITGFPGETELEFSESLKFVRRMNFAGGHVFTYSERPGTAAARMPDQVPHTVRKARNAAMRSVFEKSSAEYRTRFVGEKMAVLWETAAPENADNWKVRGLTDNYLRVAALVPRRIWNQITPVRLTGVEDGGMLGEIVYG
jgi:threonylcarbamoyladenosine tRNA methylthiotransferase MtaB